MKIKSIVLFLLLSFIGGSAWAYDNTYAVIVGVADYQNLDESNLEFTASDAVNFYNFLKSKKGGSVPESNMVLLTNSQATKANIINSAKTLFAKAKKNDRVIFYFSGHGSSGCFIPYDYSQMGYNILYYDDVKAMFRVAKCNTKLLFADACFSGSMKDDLEKNSQYQQNVTNGKRNSSNMNIAVMMSCSNDEYSLEAGDLRQGLFTYYLMKGLGGSANTDGSKFVTIQELFYYVYHQVKDDADSRGHKQTPQLFGKFDLRLIVAKI